MSAKIMASRRKDIIYSVIAVLLLLIMLFPLYWIFVTSLKLEKEIFRNPPTFWPTQLNRNLYGAA